MTTTSREYAEALFELAVQGNETKETSEGLETVVSALLQTPDYRAMLASPAISKEERLNALDSAFRGKIPDILLAILRMMISRGHVSALNGMARDYEELARGYRGESVAVVTSAVPLKEAETVALRAKLEKKLSKTVIMQFRVDPELIGGIRVEVDGRVIDGSIRNKLDEIKEVMNA
ncbi:ATP synthase F1 subunit delta [Aristaeella lactis]|jgi:F-type H+-transporting ATPase subunit delta|uniref:F-type H+-transporting ATPase subunit delta n=1 Tax=Aristaeella lactis TaxID=3046383 RepID=A0AC61PMQ7_9FIRM|nr:ATP synthase F1 subunit delta [Aristaeella lactis]QUA52664.1 ATP synthase F1 subunit delta [Aristaeella lactis]SMC71407.1 F-type H+-transporting ATPase subunit delta [Aristaeella lactis]